MGIVAMSDLDRLFWAGRYCERAVSVCDAFLALPSDESVRADFCRRLGAESGIVGAEIPILGQSGIVRSSARAFRDNAVRLRHCLGSRAVKEAESAAAAGEDGDFDLMRTHAYAFVGMTLDRLTDKTARCTFEAGRMTERLDVTSRLDEDVALIAAALSTLKDVIGESEPCRRLIDAASSELIERALREGEPRRVKLYTPRLETDVEYS